MASTSTAMTMSGCGSLSKQASHSETGEHCIRLHVLLLFRSLRNSTALVVTLPLVALWPIPAKYYDTEARCL